MGNSPFAGGSKLDATLRQIAAKASSAKLVNVGFLEGATYPDGTSVPMVAAINEYGAPKVGIPPRPFMRPTVSSESPHWGNDLSAVLRANDYDAAKSLGQMGDEIASEIRKAIVAVTAPALSPVTLLLRERFGNNPQAITFSDVQRARQDIASGRVPKVTDTQAKPLEWTGHLLNSVDYEVK